jgi:hypothetical protein
MPLIRIVATEWTEQQLHAEALRESRTASAMGQTLLREALDARKARAAEQAELLKIGQTVVLENTLASILRAESESAAR